MNIKELEDKLLEYKKAYYTGKPLVSDSAYDQLEEQLRSIAPDSKVLRVVGYELNVRGKIKHDKPMLSLEKEKSVDSLKEWASILGTDYLATYKMDGSSGSMIYENGKFFIAKTRGNGVFGEAFTEQADFMNFPKNLPLDSKIEIRGEVLIRKSKFEKLCVEMEKRGLEIPKSVRNVPSGLIHRKENLDLCNYLSFVAYDIVFDGAEYKTELSKLGDLQKWGFEIPCFKKMENLSEEFNEFATEYQRFCENGDYLTDGIVISVNSIEKHEIIGYTDHHPKFKKAFKFGSETALTKILDIKMSVNRTGKFSFVAEVEPIELAGATISRVTLHNPSYMMEHQINVGALIEIVRSNEVIPKHENTIESNGDFQFPTHCPSCGSELSWSKTDTDLICDNDNCDTKIFKRLLNWVHAANIYDISHATVSALYELDIVKKISDFYKITEDDLLRLEGIKSKLAKKIYNSIQESRNVESHKIFAGLGISLIGSKNAKLILENEMFGSMKRFVEFISENDRNFSESILVSIKGIGPESTKKVLEFFGNADNLIEVENILEAVNEIIVEKKSGKLDGMSFVITGTLSRQRKEIEKDIENAGGKNASGVKTSTYLVANVKSCSSKFKEAEKHNIPIITEEELYTLING
jgi:DNA ligase (NAD+)